MGFLDKMKNFGEKAVTKAEQAGTAFKAKYDEVGIEGIGKSLGEKTSKFVDVASEKTKDFMNEAGEKSKTVADQFGEKTKGFVGTAKSYAKEIQKDNERAMKSVDGVYKDELSKEIAKGALAAINTFRKIGVDVAKKVNEMEAKAIKDLEEVNPSESKEKVNPVVKETKEVRPEVQPEIKQTKNVVTLDDFKNDKTLKARAEVSKLVAQSLDKNLPLPKAAKKSVKTVKAPIKKVVAKKVTKPVAKTVAPKKAVNSKPKPKM